VILGTAKIRELLEQPAENPADRLVICPLLDLDKQLKPGTASVDVRLGQRFHVPLRGNSTFCRPAIERIYSSTRRTLSSRLGIILSYTRGSSFSERPWKWVHLPKNLTAFVIGKSSWGRDGLIIATAIGVHPNFSGMLTLEISNVGEIPIYLYPGLAIAQLFLASVEPGREVAAPEPSAFLMQTSPRTRNVEIEDREVIEVFRKRLQPH